MAVKTRWDQKTYRRHMFNKGRGVRSLHDTSNTKVGTAEFVDSKLGEGSWWEASWRSPWAGRLDAAKEYEQYNNPASAGWSPFTLDSTERKQFREQDRKEVRDLFQKQLANHHFSKHKKLTGGQLDKIVDAYMSQDDDKFQATLAGMGFSDKDAGRVRRAAEDSATAAIEGTAYGTKWDDDDYAKQSGAKPGTAAAGNQPGQAGQGGAVANGQPKAGQSGAAQGQALTPRQPGAKEARHLATAASTRRPYQRPGASYNDLDGAHVRQGSPAEIHTEQSLAARAQTMALRDQQEAQNQVARSAHDQSRAYQESMDERERVEQIGRDRRARQAAEREAAAQRRADKRFADRTLYNEADWKNLGRAEGNKADYSARKEGESDESWNAREKAIKERQGRMGSLLERLDRMADTKNEANDFYQYDPNKQKNLARLRQLIVKAGADGNDVVRDDITDAQIEGANATLDAWEKGAAKRKAEIKSFSDMKQAEQIARLRNQYGPAFSDYTPEQLLDYDKRQRESARVEILKGMQVAPGLTPDQAGQDAKDLRPSAMAKFSQDWQKLLDTGFNPTTTFREKILGDPSKKEAYEAGLATLSKNDPDYADKADQLRRRFIVQQAMEQYGIGQEGGGERGQAGRQIKPPVQKQPGADDSVGIDREFWGEPPAAQVTTNKQRGEALAQNLPGQSVLQPRQAVEIANPIQPKQPQQTSGVQVFNSAADAMQARNAANAAAGLRPRQPQAGLRPGDKREETMAW